MIVENNQDEEELELPFFDQAAIAKATNGFSINNKLGEGGFGAVYMVIMQHNSLIEHKIAELIICLYAIGYPNRWTRNCCEKTLTKFWTRV